MEKYNKPALSIVQQTELLFNRGLKGISRPELEEILSTISYYRLRGYTYPYQENNKDGSPFRRNVLWSSIWSDYCLDINLRSLIFPAIGAIEVTFLKLASFYQHHCKTEAAGMRMKLYSLIANF